MKICFVLSALSAESRESTHFKIAFKSSSSILVSSRKKNFSKHFRRDEDVKEEEEKLNLVQKRGAKQKALAYSTSSS
jgi:hypothetical protein